MRYFEDLRDGETFELGSFTLREDEIVAFASHYDPQPFHIDAAAAARSPFGGLIASGWQVGSEFMGLLVRAVLHDWASQGAGGLDELRWLKPVRADEALRGRLTILSRRPSEKHPRGTVTCLGELFRGDERVFFVRWGVLVGRRP